MARLLSLLLLWPVLALAQSWPSHPITILMGFPAGSGVDVVARLLQEPMEKALHGRIVTDYRTGAGQSRLRSCGARETGWLYPAARHGGDAWRQCGAVQETAVRRGSRLHTDRAARQRVERADDQSAGDRREHGARVHRRRAAQSREIQLRL